MTIDSRCSDALLILNKVMCYENVYDVRLSHEKTTAKIQPSCIFMIKIKIRSYVYESNYVTLKITRILRLKSVKRFLYQAVVSQLL